MASFIFIAEKLNYLACSMQRIMAFGGNVRRMRGRRRCWKELSNYKE